jgi:cellulose synthase/poly-beta-1,6-N-acetylglucosamine synthase-like glycosyltransferase
LAVWDLLLAALSLLIALGWVAVLVVSRRNVSLVPSLGRSEGNEDRLTVSVIVPARNEANVLPATLESLLAQRGLRKEVILVDDHSTDGTELTASLYLDRRRDGWGSPGRVTSDTSTRGANGWCSSTPTRG